MIHFSPGVAQKIRDLIQEWGIAPGSIAKEIFARLEELDEDPRLGKPDPDRSDIFAGALFYNFRVERLPIVMRITVAYALRRGEDGHVVEILDLSPLKDVG